MSITNSSYIASNTELWIYLDQTHIYGLVTAVEADLEETLSDALSSEQQDRLTAALNWGREQIDNKIREKYVVSSLVAADAPGTLKMLNARFSQYFLERRKFRNVEGCADSIEDLNRELVAYALEKTVDSLDLTRQASPVATAVDYKGTQFDRSTQFDNIIPTDERDQIWPDRANL